MTVGQIMETLEIVYKIWNISIIKSGIKYIETKYLLHTILIISNNKIIRLKIKKGQEFLLRVVIRILIP
jgi:hypothetical protein